MTPLFLNSPALLAEWWDRAATHFAPVVNEAARGEFTVTDIRRLCDEGRATAVVVCDGDNVILAAAFEFIHYPQITTCNVMAIGGTRLDETMQAFFITFKEWCDSIGVTVIEASCSPPMSRLLSRYGFVKTYEVVRLAI